MDEEKTTVEKILDKLGEILQPYLGTGMAGQAASQIAERHKMMKEAMGEEEKPNYTLE